jgi:phosphoribosylanthranilate isomerase
MPAFRLQSKSVVHTRIKICGITRPEDARSAADSGADAIGLVFYPGSRRAISVDRAAEIVASLPPFVTCVALFVDESAEQIGRTLARVPVDMIQFHGDESPAFCRQFGRPWIKALRVRPGLDIAALSARYGDARAILLDAWEEGVPGGTGKTFDWALAPAALNLPVVLAGGLNPTNVGAAVAMLRPDAVDVSGGVESSPGIKDAVKIADFVSAVRAAEQGVESNIDDQ